MALLPVETRSFLPLPLVPRIFYHINLCLKREDSALPVYIDSPMAVSATEISNHNECFDWRLYSCPRTALEFPTLHYVRQVEESCALNENARFNDISTVECEPGGFCTISSITVVAEPTYSRVVIKLPTLPSPAGIIKGG